MSDSRSIREAPRHEVGSARKGESGGAKQSPSIHFLNLTRRTDLPSPKKFEPTRKEIGDVVI